MRISKIAVAVMMGASIVAGMTACGFGAGANGESGGDATTGEAQSASDERGGDPEDTQEVTEGADKGDSSGSVGGETTPMQTEDVTGQDTKGGGSVITADGGISGYAVKVGYHSDLDGSEMVTIRSKDEWDAYSLSLAETYYDGQGNEIKASNDELHPYDDDFFSSGNLVVARYFSMGSGSYSPSLTDIEIDDRGTASVTCDYGVGDGDVLLTADMSGFVVVMEVPATSDVAVTDIEIS